MNKEWEDEEYSKAFYSNCFVEMLKHKLRDWKNIKVTYIPPMYNECFCPHFLWSDGKYDYDFGVEKHLKWYQIFWFKGCIRCRKLGWNKKWKEYRIAKKKQSAVYEDYFGKENEHDGE